MGTFAAGQVVTLNFPFSDLTRTKLRPVLLLANAGRADWIVCQITSNPHADPLAIPLAGADFVHGGLDRLSFICPGKLFTANESTFAAYRGDVVPTIHQRVADSVIAIVRGSRS
jgi:mRNA interferase MazF